MKEFHQMISQTMGSMLASYGFQSVSQESSVVIYESQLCRLTIVPNFLGSTEIYFGLKSYAFDHGADFAIDEIFNALSVPEALKPPGYATKGEAGTQKLVSLVATLLGQYCEQLLRGDETVWRKLHEHRAAASEEYAIDTNKRLALAAAETAWHEKNWQKYFDLLDGLRPHLSSADLAKLDYAARRMKPH